jgi:hypothetical protein
MHTNINLKADYIRAMFFIPEKPSPSKHHSVHVRFQILTAASMKFKGDDGGSTPL